MDGFLFHTLEGVPYWEESACYLFSENEVHEIERATGELQRLCLEAAQYIIDNQLFHLLHIPDWVIPVIKRAWETEPPSLYGRFDLAYDGRTPPKMLEYNADTPTSLYEAAVVQWNWLQDVFPRKDQFNSLHESLLAKWHDLIPVLASPRVHFAHCDSIEDMITVAYLQETAQQAGLETAPMVMEEIGWREGRLLDLDDTPIHTLFKLYPWEWLVNEADLAGRRDLITASNTLWIEPIWKMLWSNKALLPILWELFPGHPNLLPAYFEDARGMERFVRKPLLSREGANVTLFGTQDDISTLGDYGEEGFVYQALASLPVYEGRTPVIGSWVIDGAPAGMGIRESVGPITDNQSRFLPHVIA